MANPRATDYKKLNAELEAVTAALENPDLDIDEAVKHYERGMEIIQELNNYLKNAENTVAKVKAQWKKTP